MTAAPLSVRIYHYLDALSPVMANGYASLVLRSAQRVVVETPRGRFWVSRLSYFGRELLEGREHEPETAESLIRYLPSGGVFVDAGANEGYFAVQGAKLCGPTGVVWAIEPQPRCHAIIRKNCELNDVNNVQTAPVGISDRTGQLTLYLHPATNTGATSSEPIGHLPGRRFQVDSLTLEAFLDANGIDHVDLLKLDIEGGEYEAVLGSPQVFRKGRVKAINLEYHPRILRLRGLDPKTIHDFLSGCGYVIDAAHKTRGPESPVDETAVYVRRCG